MARKQQNRNDRGPRGGGGTELQATADDVQEQGLVAVSGVLRTELVVFCLFVPGERQDVTEEKMPSKSALTQTHTHIILSHTHQKRMATRVSISGYSWFLVSNSTPGGMTGGH